MIDIKNIEGSVIISVEADENAISHEELMQSDYIKLSWQSDENVTLPAGAYVDYGTEKYRLLEPYTPAQQDECTYQYTPQFKSRIMNWDKQVTPVYTYEEDGTTVKSRDMDWEFTGSPADAMYIVKQAIKNETGEYWTIQLSDSLPATISISSQSESIFSVLNSIASECDTEWWGDKKTNTLYLSKCIYGEPIKLEVGDNVQVPSVSIDSEGYYTRFYAFGSTRNIVQKTAQTGAVVSNRLTLDPAKYPGGYKDIRPGLRQEEIFVKTLFFDSIYPSSKLTISDVRARLRYRLDNSGNKIKIGGTDEEPVYEQYAIWYFQIAGFTFDPETIIDEKNLSASFESGQLASRDFELTYHEKAETVSDANDVTPFEVKAGDYEIIIDETSGQIIPGVAYIIPQEGDSVILYNIEMPAEYTASAQAELEAELDKEMAKYSDDNNTYQMSSDPTRFYAQGTDIQMGQAITYVNGKKTLSTRVQMVEKRLDMPCYQTIKVGNKIIKGNTQQLKDEVASVNQNIDVIQAFNELSASLSQSYANAQREMIEGFASIRNMWRFDPDRKDTIYSIYNVYSEKGLASKGWIDAEGGGGTGGATSLGQLINVGSWADEVPSYDRVLVQLTGATHWTEKKLSELVGLDETALSNYLTTNNYAKKSDIPSLEGYATHSWVTSQGYATTTYLDDRINDLINGAPAAYDTLKEIADVLQGNVDSIGDILTVLGTKADKATTLAGYGITDAYTKLEVNSLLDTKLDASVFNDLFEKVEISTGVYAIRAKYGLYSDKFISAKGLYEGEESTGASNLSDLKDVSLTELAANDMLKWNGEKWVNIPMSSISVDTSKFVTINTAQIITAIKNHNKPISFKLGNTDDGIRFINKDTGGNATGLYLLNGSGAKIAGIGFMTSSVDSYGYSFIGWGDNPWLDSSNFSVSNSKLQYKTYSILHTGNYSTTLDTRYVKKAGDTMTGALTINYNVYPQLKINNGSGGYSTIKFQSSGTDKVSVGYSSVVGALLQNNEDSSNYINIKSGNLLWNNTSKFWHSGNDGSGSGLDADLLDGRQGTSYAIAWSMSVNTDKEEDDTTSTSITDFLTRLNYSGLFGNTFGAMRGSWYYVGNTQYNTGVGRLEMAGTAVLNMSLNPDLSSTYKTLLFLEGPTGNMYSYVSQESGVARWSRYAKTTDNVASATKLQTARTIWGQSFNGTANVDGKIKLTTWDSDGVAIRLENVNAGTGFISIYTYTGNAYTLGQNNTRFIISHNYYGDIFNINTGKVGIGTTSPSYKLHVAGTTYATSVMSSNIRIECDNSGVLGNRGGEINSYNTRLYLQHNTVNDLICCGGGGNIGVGISTPSHRLHVIGDIYASTNITGANIIAYHGKLQSTCNGKIISIYSENPSWCHYRTNATNGHWFGNNVTIQGNLESYGGTKNLGSNSARWNVWAGTGNFSGAVTMSSTLSVGGTFSVTGRATLSGGASVGYSNTSYMLSCSSFICSSWVRTAGTTGWYNETYGGGIYMIDTTWVRLYGSKYFYAGNGIIRTDYLFDRQGYNGAPWYKGYGAYNVAISNNASQTPLLLAYRSGQSQSATGANRLFSMELLNNGSLMYLCFGGAMKYSLSSDGVFYARSGMYSDGYVSAKGQNQSSDVRLKNILCQIHPSLEAFAKAPLFKFAWKSDPGMVEIGSSAQYWRNVLPDTVKERDGWLEMGYGNIALAGVITIAREVETLEQRVERLERENKELKKKIATLVA